MYLFFSLCERGGSTGGMGQPRDGSTGQLLLTVTGKT
jgi:hypothetical protein